MPLPQSPAIVLASGSAGRAALLHAAGLAFTVHPAVVDEAPVRATGFAAGQSVGTVALRLATLKAAQISRQHPQALVIGADQMLTCDGHSYDKPADRAVARRQLQALQGRTHVLHTACVCCRGGIVLWRHLAHPALTMRPLNDGWIDAYLQAEGNAVLGCVGVYRIEARGIQCFSRIRGEHAAIVGLPMLALLAALRRHGAMPA